MASPEVCFTRDSIYSCSAPPPELPDKPNFTVCPSATTTQPPTTTTEGTTTTGGTTTTEGTTTTNGTTTTEGTTTTNGTTTTEGTTTITTATSSSTTLELLPTDVTNGTTISQNETTTTPLITTEDVTDGSTTSITPCSPNDTFCSTPKPSTANPAVIAGATCGVVIFLILLGLLIWWFWKKGKLCFRHQEGVVKAGSQECLPDNEEKQVELVNIKKGTVVLNPINNPPQLPPLRHDGPPPKPPIQNTDPGLTPVEGPKQVEETGASPSKTAEARSGSATSKTGKRRLSRSNKVSPAPTPEPKQQVGT